MAAGRDQQRRAARLEAHLGGEGQAGPVGPVKQPDHFWQAGHGGTIRGKSAGEAGTPPRLVNYALGRPGTRTARVTALVSGAETGSYVGRVGSNPRSPDYEKPASRLR